MEEEKATVSLQLIQSKQALRRKEWFRSFRKKVSHSGGDLNGFGRYLFLEHVPESIFHVRRKEEESLAEGLGD